MMMFDSSIFNNKNKLTRHNMKRILRKFPRYRYEYLDKHFEDKVLQELPFMKLSCEFCKKYVASIVTKDPNGSDKILYERYTQFQVICYDCYDKKLQFKVPDNIEDRDVHTFPKMPTEPFNLKPETFKILFVNYIDRIRAFELLGLYDTNGRVKILNGEWLEIYKVSKQQIEKLKENGIKFNYLGDFFLERQL